jgi:hypothetical protein
MFDRYIKVNDRQIIAGQTNNGFWYCKELKAENPSEVRFLIGEVNKILNEYNNTEDKKK